jgi:hypothetical protein
VVFLAGVATFDDLVYGGPLASGYRPGEITFSLAAIPGNVRFMPGHLIEAMPGQVVRVPARAALATLTTAAVVLVMFGLGAWAFADMRDRAFLGPPHGGRPHGPVVHVNRDPRRTVALGSAGAAPSLGGFYSGPPAQQGVPYAIAGGGTAGNREVS